MSTKVLVTGANGQLGSTIKELYSTNQDNIQFTFTTKEELDISKRKEIQDFFKTNNFDYCINCAAFTNVEQAEKTPETAFKINAEGVKYLAQICKVTNTVLIHISTDYVFDGSKNEPYSELDIPNPINEYGKSKLLGEQHIQNTLEEHFIIRTSWLYSEYGTNFMKTMLRLSEGRDELNVICDQTGTPTYAKDLAGIILEIINRNNKQYGIYHYSNLGDTNWYDFAKTIFEFLGIKIKLNPIKSEVYPTLAKRSKYSVLDKSKIKKKFGVEIPFWKDSLQKVISNIK